MGLPRQNGPWSANRDEIRKKKGGVATAPPAITGSAPAPGGAGVVI